MPDYIGYAYEAVLFLAGCVVLFRLCATQVVRARWSEPRLGPWNGSGADLVLLLLLSVCGAIGLPWLTGFYIRRSTLDENAIIVLLEVAFEGGLLLGAAIFFKLIKFPRAEPAASGGFRSGALAFAVSVPIILAVSLAWQTLLGWTGVAVNDQTAVDQFEHLHSAVLKLGFIGVAVIIAPLAEEAIFRAGIYRYLRGRVWIYRCLRIRVSNRWAVAVSSVLFGCAHIVGSSWKDQIGSLPQLIVLGAILAVAYERTGSLRTSVIAHALFNLNTLVGLLLGIAT